MTQLKLARPSSISRSASACAGRSAAGHQATMRVDYYHTGNDKEERFSLDRVVVEPLPWPGNPAKPIDDTNRGKYFFEVVDAASGRTLYSRGFSSIYGEWETTAEAQVDEPHVLRVAAISRRRQARADRPEEARRTERFSSSCGRVRRSRPTSSSSAAAGGAARVASSDS